MDYQTPYIGESHTTQPQSVRTISLVPKKEEKQGRTRKKLKKKKKIKKTFFLNNKRKEEEEEKEKFPHIGDTDSLDMCE